MQPLGEYRPKRRRSKAWVYYAAITVFVVVGSFAAGKPASVFLAIIPGLYAWYLYRGGRIVIWFW